MSEAHASQPSVLFLSNDLFFTSKVTGIADTLGCQVDVRGTLPDRWPYRLVILDLGCSLSPAEVMSRLPGNQRPRVLAFGQHVATQRLQEAEAAGCDDVMPRSRFSANLPEILRSALE